MDHKLIESMMLMGDTGYQRVASLRHGILRHEGHINEYSVEHADEDLRTLLDLTSFFDTGMPNPVEFRILGSNGGQADSALGVHDMLRAFGKAHAVDIMTSVFGNAYSAAAMILLQAGDIRVASENSFFLLHEVRSFAFGENTVSDMKDTTSGMNKINEVIYQNLANRCSKTLEEVKEFIDRHDVWMTAEEALEWNLIDKII